MPTQKLPAHNWTSAGKISIKENYIKDEFNRTILFRGVNLCGNSKLPTYPNGSSHLSEGFFDHRNVCFVGRPFPQQDLEVHLERLCNWGLTFVRLLVPWEALEHAGPGIYDEDFIDSLIATIKKASSYGMKCFIDPHQDVWSRFSGGSGAPGWTFEVAGLDMTHFKETGAAYVHNVEPSPTGPPTMIWPTNYTKLASSTMFTLFFGGNVFAPNRKYQGETVQDFLQKHFLKCYHHLARRLGHLDAIVGFEVLNEPSPGYIGLKNLENFNPLTHLKLGDSPSAFQSFILGDGFSQDIDVYVKSWPYPTRKAYTRIVNIRNERAWQEGVPCVWREHGVWDYDAKSKKHILLKPDYFSINENDGKPYSFSQDFYLPFIIQFAHAVHLAKPDWFIFFEPVPNEPPPNFSSCRFVTANEASVLEESYSENGIEKLLQEGDMWIRENRIVYSPHWYDLKSVFSKSFTGFITHDVQGLSSGTKNLLNATYFGLQGAFKNYAGQLQNLVSMGQRNIGNVPNIIGECGIPMDLNEKKAFETGDFTHHTNMLHAVLRAMEENLVMYTLWNYNPVNDNTHGDHWNGEDFSIFSVHQKFCHLRKARSRTSSHSSGTNSYSPRKLRSRTSSHGTPNEDDTGSSVVVGSGTIATRRMVETSNDINDESIASSVASSTESINDPFDIESAKLIPSAGITPSNTFDLTAFHLKENDQLDDDSHHHVGGRALDAVIRPFAAKIAGVPITSQFNLKTLEFILEFMTPVEAEDPNMVSNNETEIFLPRYHYGYDPIEVWVSDGEWEYVEEHQSLYYRHTSNNAPKEASISSKVSPLHAPPMTLTLRWLIDVVLTQLMLFFGIVLSVVGWGNAKKEFHVHTLKGKTTSSTVKSGSSARKPSVITYPVEPGQPANGNVSKCPERLEYEVHWIKVKSLREEPSYCNIM